MVPTSRAVVPSARAACPWLLVGLVLISLLGMHFLSGRDSAGHHRVLIPAATASMSPAAETGTAPDGAARTQPGSTIISAAPVDGPGGHQITVIGDLLLLLVGLGTALSWWLHRRSVGERPKATGHAPQGTVRGPPRTPARLVLCVERT